MNIDFEISENLIVASHITGIYDVNRNSILANDDFTLVSEWVNSITSLGLHGIIFHNNFSDTTCQQNQSNLIHFIRVDYDAHYNPNVFRYIIYSEFLKLYSESIKNIFFTDISDVRVLKNPFLETLYLNNPSSLFCGDEPKTLDNEWMQLHSQHLRSKISDYSFYETKFKNDILLNCGIMGGSISIMQLFINELSAIHQKYNSDNNSPYTGDMGAFNYLIKKKYTNCVIHGSPVNTEFKTYSEDYACWFKHK